MSPASAFITACPLTGIDSTSFEKYENPHYSGSLPQHISARVLWCYSSFHLLPFQIFPKMFSEADVWWLWRESTQACQHSLLFPGLQTDLAQRHCMFRAIVLLENESFLHTISSQKGRHASEEWSGTFLWSVWSSSCVSHQFLTRQNIPTPEYFHCIWL